MAGLFEWVPRHKNLFILACVYQREKKKVYKSIIQFSDFYLSTFGISLKNGRKNIQLSFCVESVSLQLELQLEKMLIKCRVVEA